MPVAISILHWVSDGRLAVPAVKVNKAVPDPELEDATVKAVVPQPEATGVARVPHVNSGKVRLILSPASTGTLKENVNLTADGADVTLFTIVR
jgi:hypothetical protein